MLDLIRQLLPDVTAVEERHGSGRVRHLLVTTGDGRARPCVLRRAPLREWELYRTVLAAGVTGAPALLGGAPAGAGPGPGGTAPAAPGPVAPGPVAPAPATPAPAPGEAWLLLEALPERFPDFANPAEVAACYRHLAAIHTHYLGHPSPSADGPWAIAAAEITAVLTASPETAPLAAEAAAALTAGPSTLVHGDYHRWNLLLIDGQVRVLDWEHASFAPPCWDLAMLAPEEPGWDGVPRGALALHALQRYHEAGPLARLAWADFLRRQTLARLFVAARWALRHQAKADRLPPGGPREQIEQYAEAERQRVKTLAARLL